MFVKSNGYNTIKWRAYAWASSKWMLQVQLQKLRQYFVQINNMKINFGWTQRTARIISTTVNMVVVIWSSWWHWLQETYVNSIVTNGLSSLSSQKFWTYCKLRHKFDERNDLTFDWLAVLKPTDHTDFRRRLGSIEWNFQNEHRLNFVLLIFSLNANHASSMVVFCNGITR